MLHAAQVPFANLRYLSLYLVKNFHKGKTRATHAGWFIPTGWRKPVADYSGSKFCSGFPASPQNPVFMSLFAHLHIMHPEPKHLKNFARASQWSRGKKVRNIAFFTRSQRPGLERLNATTLDCHRIRAIGHHIDRLACCSVTIMAASSFRMSEDTWNNAGTNVLLQRGLTHCHRRVRHSGVSKRHRR